MGAGPKDMRARVWIPAEGALAIRCLSKIGLLKTPGQFGIPEGPMPELEGILTVQVFNFLELLVKCSQNRCEMAGTSIGLAACHSPAYGTIVVIVP